jgi:hypothetical protein
MLDTTLIILGALAAHGLRHVYKSVPLVVLFSGVVLYAFPADTGTRGALFFVGFVPGVLLRPGGLVTPHAHEIVPLALTLVQSALSVMAWGMNGVNYEEHAFVAFLGIQAVATALADRETCAGTRAIVMFVGLLFAATTVHRAAGYGEIVWWVLVAETVGAHAAVALWGV